MADEGNYAKNRKEINAIQFVTVAEDTTIRFL